MSLGISSTNGIAGSTTLSQGSIVNPNLIHQVVQDPKFQRDLMVLIMKHAKEIQISRQDMSQAPLIKPVRKISEALSSSDLRPLIDAHKTHDQDPLNLGQSSQNPPKLPGLSESLGSVLSALIAYPNISLYSSNPPMT